MSRIFLSHSSKDLFEAIAISEWLAAEGWDDVFLDADPERGINPGERWERALHQAAQRCEAVVFLISRNWLASGWCRREYELARSLNKQLFGVLIDAELMIEEAAPEFSGTWQLVSLVPGQDGRMFSVTLPSSHEERHVTFGANGLRRLKRGLEKAGLDPKFFAWPPAGEPGRAPYRGLKSLETGDAGIFFGRDAPTVEGIDRLRELAVAAPPRLLAILGASGAGKSSFLRAGLLPRLARDDAHFLPLPPIRPERAAITGDHGLIHALDVAMPGRARAEWRRLVGEGAGAIRPLLADFVHASYRRTLAEGEAGKRPAVVVAIDQAEELFRPAGVEEGAALLAILRDLMIGEDPSVIVVCAIRSDSYDALEQAKPLEGLRQATLPLLPMPRAAYKEVIEGPARRLAEAGRRLAIEPQLAVRLLTDIEDGGGSDALPLLAFTLEQLFLEYGGAGALRLADYEVFGGLRGAIDAAVERAFVRADADGRIPRDRAEREKLLRRGLVPWLAGIDPDSKSPRRNIARARDIPPEAAPLIELLVEERLLSTDTKLEKDPATGAEIRTKTIEPAHEALLRQWGLLHGWLSEDFGLLATLEAVSRAARDWDANARDPAWLAHQGQRLADAQALDTRPDIAAKLDAVDRVYLAACQGREETARQETETRRQEREAAQARALRDARALSDANKRRTRAVAVGLIGALVLAAASIGFGWDARNQRLVAERQTAKALTQEDIARRAAVDAENQRDAAKQSAAREREALMRTSAERNRALLGQSRFLVSAAETLRINHVNAALLAAEALPQPGDREPRPYLPDAEAMLAQKNRRMTERLVLAGHGAGVTSAKFSPDGRLVVTSSWDGSARIWDAESGRPSVVFRGHRGLVSSATFSPDGKQVLTCGTDGVALIFDPKSGRQIASFEGHTAPIRRASFSSDGHRIVTASDDATVRVWDAARGHTLAILKHDEAVRDVAFGADDQHVVSISEKAVQMWNVQTGKIEAANKTEGYTLNGVAFRPDGQQVAIATRNGFLLTFDAKLTKLDRQPVSQKEIERTAYSPDGRLLATANEDGSVYIFDAGTVQMHDLKEGHASPVTSAEFSSDHLSLVTASTDGTARIWAVGSKIVTTVLSGHTNDVSNAAFSDDGQKIVTDSADKTVRLWDAQTGRLTATLDGIDAPGRATFDKDGQRVVATFGSFEVTGARVWDATNGHLLKVYPSGFTPAFSADGRFLAAQADGGALQVWDTSSGQTINGAPSKPGRVKSAQISPDGRWVVVVLDDGSMRTIDVRTGKTTVISKELMVIEGIAGDGRHMIQLYSDTPTASAVGSTLRIREVATGRQTALLAHPKFVSSASFSPDSKLVLTASWDSTVRIWDAATGSLVLSFGQPDANMTNASFSHDGRRIITTAEDGIARVWNASSGQIVDQLPHVAAVNHASFSPDGRFALAIVRNKTVQVWRVFPTTNDLIEDTRKKVARCLTGEEREKYFLPQDPPDWCIEAGKWPYQARSWKVWLDGKRQGKVAPSPRALLDRAASLDKQGDDLYRAGNVASAIASAEQSLAAMRQLADIDGPDGVAQMGIAKTSNSLCWYRAIAGQLEAALAHCNESLQRRGGDPATLDSRGFVHLRLGHFSQAIADYDEALRRTPQSASSLYGRGLAKIKRGEKGETDVAAAEAIDGSIKKEFAGYGLQ